MVTCQADLSVCPLCLQVLFSFTLVFTVTLSLLNFFCVNENADKVGIVQKENPLLCLFAIRSFVICYYIMESRNNCTLAFG